MLVYLRDGLFVGWLIACLKSRQHAGVSQGRFVCRLVGCCLLNVPGNVLVCLRDGLFVGWLVGWLFAC